MFSLVFCLSYLFLLICFGSNNSVADETDDENPYFQKTFNTLIKDRKHQEDPDNEEGNQKYLPESEYPYFKETSDKLDYKDKGQEAEKLYNFKLTETPETDSKITPEEDTLNTYKTSNKPLAGAAITANKNRIQIGDQIYDSNEHLSYVTNTQTTKKYDSKEMELFASIFSGNNLRTFNSKEENTESKESDENLIGYFGPLERRKIPTLPEILAKKALSPTDSNENDERHKNEDIDDAEVVEYNNYGVPTDSNDNEERPNNADMDDAEVFEYDIPIYKDELQTEDKEKENASSENTMDDIEMTNNRIGVVPNNVLKIDEKGKIQAEVEKGLSRKIITEDQGAFLKMPETYSLKGIRSLISPALLQALASSGWEDDIAVVDSTFPANHLVSQDKVIQLAGTPMVPLVVEIMKLWQLDKKDPLAVMIDEENKVSQTTNTLTQIILEAEEKFGHIIEIRKEYLLTMEQFKERAEKANYIVRTGEPGPWNSIIIRKGLILESRCKE